MKAKLKDYIDIIFADAPNIPRTYELKEEMYTDLCEKYDDLIAEGKTPSSAYHATISGVGDIGELIEELKKEAGDTQKRASCDSEPSPQERFYTSEEREAVRKYKNRCAVMTAISVAMYIICWVPLVLLGALWDDIGGMIGLAVMFLMIAAATVLFIIQGMTKPECLRNGDLSEDDDAETKKHKNPKNPVYKAISGALWMLTFVVYFAVSMAFSAWTYSWLIFLIATAIDNIIGACFDLKS